MPLQNRVLPTGDIIQTSARGTMTGNRGIIHRDDKTLGTARWSHQAWICCTLDWQGRKRAVMTGRNWTELFFLDEAVAFAAGHRPCGYCRRIAYNAFVAAWQGTSDIRPTAKEIDKALHPARVTRKRTQVTFNEHMATLPAGTLVMWHDTPHLLGENHMHPYTPEGYLDPIPRPRCGQVSVLTPRPIVTVLGNGYQTQLHSTALA